MLVVRRVTKKDFSAWLYMRMHLWPCDTKAQHEKEMLDFLSDENFAAFFIELGGEPIGFLEAYIRRYANGCQSLPVPFLEGIWISQEYRGRGFSKNLVAKFEEWAKDLGFSEVGSDAEIENQSSINAHKSWGYRETERVVYFRKVLI